MTGNGTHAADKRPLDRVDFRTLFRIYRIFGKHYKTHWRHLAWIYSGLFLATLLGLLSPWPIKMILDYIILKYPLPQQAQFLYAWFPPEQPEALLLVLVLAFFGIRFAQSFVSFLYKIGMQIVGSRMVAEFREQLFAHLQRLSLSFHDSARSGDLVYRFTNDIAEVRKLLVQVPQQILYRSLVMVSYIGLMLVLNWKLALIAFSIIPVMHWLNQWFGRKVQDATREKRSKESDVTSLIVENVTAMALIQAYGREDLQQQRFDAENKQSLESGVRALMLSKIYKRLNNVLMAVGTALILYFGGNLAMEGVILPGTVVLFVSYLKNLYGPLDKFAELLLGLARSQVACERLLELLECELVTEDAPDAVEAPPFKGKIEFKDVSFAYVNTADVLKHISFVIEPGERVALVGHSGAGKSTLISLLLRFYDPQSGRILIDDKNIQTFTLQSLRNQITVVMQNAPLFNQSVRENIAFGKEGATEEEIIRAAKLAQAHEFIINMPDGYDTVISENGENLSGGQRQRINIARAIIRNTPIVILDEPATALDGETETKINRALEALTRGKTTLIVAHKFSTIVRADKIMLLRDGELVAFGPHEELIRECVDYKELYDLQTAVVA